MKAMNGSSYTRGYNSVDWTRRSAPRCQRCGGLFRRGLSAPPTQPPSAAKPTLLEDFLRLRWNLLSTCHDVYLSTYFVYFPQKQGFKESIRDTLNETGTYPKKASDSGRKQNSCAPQIQEGSFPNVGMVWITRRTPSRRHSDVARNKKKH